MKLNQDLPWHSVLGGLILGLAMTIATPTAQANVYATNVRINGGTTNIAASAGDTVAISYVLNEAASLGTTIQVLSGSTVVAKLSLPAETQGTLRGVNEVLWDGFGASLPSGTYSVSVIAASSGYTNWTQITSDTADLNTYVFEGHGIAVDQNSFSPYYGRIFVANSFPGFGTTPGDSVGILKFNADTSGAEEGISSAGLDGHQWTGGHVSPWKLEVSADDYVYVDDLANGGEIFRWDPTISSNSLLYVLRKDNQPPGSALSGPAIVGTGANTQIWMANTNAAQLYGWSVSANSVCATNDTGTVLVTNTSNNFFDVALDKDGNTYTCARTGVNGDPSPRVFRFPAVASNGSTPETNAVWAAGGGNDTYAGASGIAVDPTGRYVAVSFEGPAGPFSTNGNTKVLFATNGAIAANIDLGVVMQGDSNHADTDCAWDAVGNLYYIDAYFSAWRAVSPPGTNQAATVALAAIQLTGSTNPPPSGPIQFTKISAVGGNITLNFSGSTNDIASAFALLSSPIANGSYSQVQGAMVTQTSPGAFQVSIARSGPTQFYRIRR